MKKYFYSVVFFLLTISIWGQAPASLQKNLPKLISPQAKASVSKIITPDVLWGKLFKDVQLYRVLGDNKTFTDAVPKFDPRVILEKYGALKITGDTTVALKNFVVQHFALPVALTQPPMVKTKSLEEHLNNLWPILTRKADVPEKYSSLLPLPNPYIVPGGRFREIYYWDSYFTMQGLVVSKRLDLVEDMLDNFAYLINTYDHIPNGNRNYYLSRSQPPYFAMMVDLLHQQKGNEVYEKYLPAMEKEYRWWMEGAEDLTTGQQNRRVVKMPDGSVLNRFYDDKVAPRQESYYEDVKTARETKGNVNAAYTNLRAGAESGWDFSSRWLADTMHLTTIETTDIIPVDLNCLLYNYELIIEKALTSQQLYTRAKQYRQRATDRRMAIVDYCWNSELHYFFDYNFIKKQTTNRYSLAGVFPLLSKIATRPQAAHVHDVLQKKFLKPGGLVTTPYATGQQWDAPNGWAPLQFIAVVGLDNYSYDELAKTVAVRWMKVNEKVYANTGKMMEKYNVENITLESGGGEYPSQDGFGWSNGVYLKFKEMYGK